MIRIRKHPVYLPQAKADPEKKCVHSAGRVERGGPAAGTHRAPNWTDSEIETLCRLYQSTPNPELARILGRKADAVKSKAASLGLTKSRSARPGIWSADEKQMLRRLYKNTPIAELKAMFNRDAAAIYNQASDLGLGKPRRRIAA